MERRSRLLTFITALIPGVGQMYLGQINRGIQLLLVFLIIRPALDIVGLGFLADIIKLILWCYSFFDTFEVARRFDRGEQVGDSDISLFKFVNSNKINEFPKKDQLWNNKGWLVWGWGLIIIGLIAIFNKTFWNNDLYALVKSFMSMYLIPILLIAGGVYMLLRNKK